MTTASRFLCGAAVLMIGLATALADVLQDHGNLPPAGTGLTRDTSGHESRPESTQAQDPIQDGTHVRDQAQDSPAEDSAAADPERARCLSRCGAQEVRCSSEVRRARSECSRKASTAGREPFARTGDYTYFCSYFGDPGRNCASGGADCQARFARRHSLCLDAMSNNVAALRYDCFKSERDAQGFCREELRDCRATCE